MIDISLMHAEQCVGGFKEDWLEYKGWDKEFYALDLADQRQALYAIRKWLSPGKDARYPESGWYRVKEACRYCLTKDIPFGDVWLPGISDLYTGNGGGGTSDVAKGEQLSRAFHLLLWAEMFPDDPYRPADLGQYRQRVDENFVRFPHMPELWGEPEYRPW